MDSVPKAVSLLLVSKVREELHDSLVADLYRDDQIDALLDENADIASRRKRLREVIALLEISQKAISEVQASSLG
jgi:dynamin 1-like protein